VAPRRRQGHRRARSARWQFVGRIAVAPRRRQFHRKGSLRSLFLLASRVVRRLGVAKVIAGARFARCWVRFANGLASRARVGHRSLGACRCRWAGFACGFHGRSFVGSVGGIPECYQIGEESPSTRGPRYGVPPQRMFSRHPVVTTSPLSLLQQPVRSASGIEPTCSADLQIGVMDAEKSPDADPEIGAAARNRVALARGSGASSTPSPVGV
jgi:hypothetical protein